MSQKIELDFIHRVISILKQQATTSNNKQQQATTSNNKQQQATTSNNKQQANQTKPNQIYLR